VPRPGRGARGGPRLQRPRGHQRPQRRELGHHGVRRGEGVCAGTPFQISRPRAGGGHAAAGGEAQHHGGARVAAPARVAAGRPVAGEARRGASAAHPGGRRPLRQRPRRALAGGAAVAAGGRHPRPVALLPSKGAGLSGLARAVQRPAAEAATGLASRRAAPSAAACIACGKRPERRRDLPRGRQVVVDGAQRRPTPPWPEGVHLRAGALQGGLAARGALGQGGPPALRLAERGDVRARVVVEKQLAPLGQLAVTARHEAEVEEARLIVVVA